jgi:hypothetical protein
VAAPSVADAVGRHGHRLRKGIDRCQPRSVRRSGRRSQRDGRRRSLARRDGGARPVPEGGLHQVRNDRRGRTAGLDGTPRVGEPDRRSMGMVPGLAAFGYSVRLKHFFDVPRCASLPATPCLMDYSLDLRRGPVRLLRTRSSVAARPSALMRPRHRERPPPVDAGP